MIPTKKRILTMNRGSSTLKCALYDVGEREESACFDFGGAGGWYGSAVKDCGCAWEDAAGYGGGCEEIGEIECRDRRNVSVVGRA